MKISRRRLLWGICILLVIAAVIATRYIWRHFIGLGPMPTRSAFINRMPSVPDGDQRRFKFFYVTNRANDDDSFKHRGNKLGNNLSFGEYNVRISPYLPIQPMVWFDTHFMTLINRHELPKDTFQSQLRQAVQASPQKSVLIIVWGFRDWFQSAALKTAYTAYALDINTPVLLFDWPGNQGEGFRGYAAARNVSLQSAPDLGRTLAKVIRETGAENIWLLGSSLGCQTICDALAWLTTQPDLIQGKPKIAHVILSAPDVAADAFDEKFADRIKILSRHLTAYVSSNDQALLMSHWINRSRRLGRKAEAMVPPSNRIGQYEFEEAMELLELQSKGARNISLVDATPINRLRNLHHFFTDSPEFFDDLYQRLLQPNQIISRRLYPVRINSQDMVYWILWNNE